MPIAPELTTAMAEHAAHEFANALFYVDGYIYCRSVSLDGFANFAWKQYEGELLHWKKFIVFLNDVMAPFRVTAIPSIDTEPIANPLDMMQRIYAREVDTSQRIANLREMSRCQQHKHDATYEFLAWFVTEQVEEENVTGDLRNLVQLAAGDAAALLTLNAGLK
jgi:ferritin